jgi:hypothetical protein
VRGVYEMIFNKRTEKAAEFSPKCRVSMIVKVKIIENHYRKTIMFYELRFASKRSYFGIGVYGKNIRCKHPMITP